MSAEENVRRFMGDYMARNGMSIVDFAKRCGFGHAAVYRWMAGGGLTVYSLERIREVTGCTWDQLLGR